MTPGSTDLVDADRRPRPGGNFERLAALKRKFNPANPFYVDQNVPPAA